MWNGSNEGRNTCKKKPTPKYYIDCHIYITFYESAANYKRVNEARTELDTDAEMSTQLIWYVN